MPEFSQNNVHVKAATSAADTALFGLHTGDPQEDAGRGQHVRAVEHGDEADRETSHPGQVHHDRRHAADLRLHVPGDQIPGLTTFDPSTHRPTHSSTSVGLFDQSRTFFCSTPSSLMIWRVAEFLTSDLSDFSFYKWCHYSLFSTDVNGWRRP